MKKLVLLLLMIICNVSYSQKIEFLERNDITEKSKEKLFVFLCSETNLTDSKLAAKIKVTGKSNDTFLLFQTIKHEAQKIGTNAFKFEKFNKVDKENGELILSLYFCNDSVFEENYKNIPKNKIYIFGDQNVNKTKREDFTINGVEYEIISGKFKEFELKIGEQLKINKGGGKTGKTYWVNGEKDKIAMFFSFTGIGLTENTHNLDIGNSTVKVKADPFNIIDPNFGLTLLNIFEPQE